MWNSLASSLSTWRIHDMWLCEKPWMNRISGPAGLPHSCADIMRPSGVFTLRGLYFKVSAPPGCATATKAAASVVLIRLLVQTDIVIETSFLFLSGRVLQVSTRADRVTVAAVMPVARNLHPFDSRLGDQVAIARQFDLDPAAQTLRPVADHLEAERTQLLMKCRLTQRLL